MKKSSEALSDVLYSAGAGSAIGPASKISAGYPCGSSGSAVIPIEDPPEPLTREQPVIAYKCVSMVGWKIVTPGEPR
jgi:hypothetical protein